MLALLDPGQWWCLCCFQFGYDTFYFIMQLWSSCSHISRLLCSSLVDSSHKASRRFAFLTYSCSLLCNSYEIFMNHIRNASSSNVVSGSPSSRASSLRAAPVFCVDWFRRIHGLYELYATEYTHHVTLASSSCDVDVALKCRARGLAVDASGGETAL